MRSQKRPTPSFSLSGYAQSPRPRYFGGMYYAAKVAEIKDLSGGYGLESQSRMKSQTTSSLCFFAHPFELKTPWAPTPEPPMPMRALQDDGRQPEKRVSGLSGLRVYCLRFGAARVKVYRFRAELGGQVAHHLA